MTSRAISGLTLVTAPAIEPLTVAEVAASIGTGLAKAALAGKVDGKVVDTSFQMTADSALSIITGKDADGLEVIRHSTAHLLAYAVKELFPDAQVTIGPVIEHGFFYDFSYKRPFTPEDLTAIEKKMTELASKDEPVVRRVLPRDEAVAYFKGLGEHYKAEIIESIPVKRMGQPEDIAHAAAYLMDDRASFVTGQTLYVCGGMTVGLSNAS